VTLKIVDSKGKPVSGASVKMAMMQSDFIWGTAVNEAQLAKDPDDTSATNYRTILKEFFNTAVIENGFKAGAWRNQGRRPQTLKAFQWLQDNGFRQRGHNLVWPAWKFNDGAYKKTAEQDTAAFRKMIEADIHERMAITKGKVVAWDVINEMIHEKELLPYSPHDAPVQWFKLAKSLDPDAQLFINEYGMLNSIASPKNIEDYIQQVQGLRSAGAPIEAVGVQGHVGRQPRNPAQVIKDLDLFVPLGLPVQITEFDINSPDEELQADYTRDFLIACYSHPVVTGFTKWGFWQGAHWKPDAAMFRRDWTPKPSAAVWREWVTKKWKTNLTASSDKKGEVAARGHLGKYEITVTKGGKTAKQEFQLTKEAKTFQVTLR
jgi:endo-1,4-beta-xylanase